MPPFTERDAEKLSPEQATALARVLEFQARWNAQVGERTDTVVGLHVRPKAHNAFPTAPGESARRHGEHRCHFACDSTVTESVTP